MATMAPGNTYTASDFYNSELNRLNQKQQNSDLIMSSNERLAGLNNSYRKRYAKYVEMLMVLVLAYIIYLGVVILQKNVPSISIYVVDYITVVLIFAVFFYLFSAFWQLSSRSVLNYDELDLSSYDASGVDVSALKDSGQLFASQGNTNAVCVGNECCPPLYNYDKDLNVCVPIATTSPYQTTSNTNFSGSSVFGSAAGDSSYNYYGGNDISGNVPIVTYSGVQGYPTSYVSDVKTYINENEVNKNISGFTTLEYSKVENAYVNKGFNSPELKRSPNYNNVAPLSDSTRLNVSNFR